MQKTPNNTKVDQKGVKTTLQRGEIISSSRIAAKIVNKVMKTAEILVRVSKKVLDPGGTSMQKVYIIILNR